MLRQRLALLVLFWISAGVLAGCATERDSAAPTPPTGANEASRARPGMPLPEILDHAFQRRDDGSLVVLDRLDEPQRIETEPVQNRHVPGQTDTLRTLVYGGLELEVYAVADGKEILQEVRVTGEGYETAEGVGVNSTRTAVREALGEPVRTEGDTLTYEISSSPEDPTPTMLDVRFEDDHVAAMTWHYYVD